MSFLFTKPKNKFRTGSASSNNRVFSPTDLKKMAARVKKEVLGSTDLMLQWVHNVTNFSSEYDSSQWPARCVTGAPRVYPRYGDIPGAWASRVKDSHQFIELEFEEPVYVCGIDIYETYHAGGVKAVKGRSAQGDWVTLWNTNQVQSIKSTRVFSPPLQDMGCRTNQIRLDIDCTACGSWVEIDAVQLKGKKFQTEPPPSLHSFAEDFKQLVNDERFSDVQFAVEGEIIHAHKIILVGRSDYFRAMFCDQMREATTQKPIVMEDVTYRSFMGLLNYLYSNELPSDTDAITLVDMWRVADRYSVEGLKTYASFQITEKLDENNVVCVYVAAFSKLPVMDNVKKACMVFISSNMSKVTHSPSFADLPHDMMLEIIQAATEKVHL